MYCREWIYINLTRLPILNLQLTMYQRNRASLWRKVTIGMIIATVAHMPFFVFASSYAFSSVAPFTAILFFFTDMLFWVSNIPLSQKMAGRSGRPFVVCLIIAGIAVLGVLHNGIGLMVAKGNWSDAWDGHTGLYWDVGGFFLFILMVFALSQAALFIFAIFIGRVSRYNPRYRFEEMNNQNDSSYVAQTNENYDYETNRPVNSVPNYQPPAQQYPVSQSTHTGYPVPSAQPAPQSKNYVPEDLPYDPRGSKAST